MTAISAARLRTIERVTVPTPAELIIISPSFNGFFFIMFDYSLASMCHQQRQTQGTEAEEMFGQACCQIRRLTVTPGDIRTRRDRAEVFPDMVRDTSDNSSSDQSRMCRAVG